MAAARQEGKPLMVDFTGFGCVNCRKMEAAVWTDPRVADRLTKDYVLVSLYVDDKTPLAGSYGYDEDVDAYLDFLSRGLRQYREGADKD